MDNLISKELQKSLDKLKTIKVHSMDREQGLKSGTLYTVEPSFKYQIVTSETLLPNGTYSYETTEKKPFNMGNILIINRYKSKQTNEWVEEKVPSFCINIKSDEQSDDNKIKYISMLFRGTSFTRLMNEIIECSTNGSSLDRSKALYSIIMDNGLTPSTFIEHLSEGGTLHFGQYKRNYNMNFVDTKYFKEKIMKDIEQTETV
jgi:hypothetical protein